MSVCQLVLGLLQARPQTSADLRDSLKVSRQRVDEMLGQLLQDGLVERHEVAGEACRFVYDLAHHGMSRIDRREPHLPTERAELLSALRSGRMHLGRHLLRLGFPWALQRRAFVDMGELGLTRRISYGKKGLVRLTMRGERHFQYRKDATKAAAVSPLEAVGEADYAILVALGEAKRLSLSDLGVELSRRRMQMQPRQVDDMIRRSTIVYEDNLLTLTSHGTEVVSFLFDSW